MRHCNSFTGSVSSAESRFSRRKLIGRVAAPAAAGVVLGSSFSKSLLADEDDGRRPSQQVLPLPIAYINPGPHQHFFFAGPVEGTAVPTDATGEHPDGRDPSTITNFNGLIGQADTNFSGTGTDLVTGAQSPYDFHADIRFMQGSFIGSDERRHRGTFGFI